MWADFWTAPQNVGGLWAHPQQESWGPYPQRGGRGSWALLQAKKVCISLLKKWPQNVIFLSFKQVCAHFCTALYMHACAVWAINVGSQPTFSIAKLSEMMNYAMNICVDACYGGESTKVRHKVRRYQITTTRARLILRKKSDVHKKWRTTVITSRTRLSKARLSPRLCKLAAMRSYSVLASREFKIWMHHACHIPVFPSWP